MKAKSKEAAWEIVDKLFPTDYMKDERASERAGYPIFKSTLDGCGAWISDINTRLEVNTEDGQTVTVWIEEESKSVCGFKVAPLYTPTPAVVVALTISGGTLAQNEAEQKAYNYMKNGDNSPAFSALEQYAKDAGIKWGTMRIESITHYDHYAPGNGHYVIQGIICPTVGDPFAFLPICSALLAEQYKEHEPEEKPAEKRKGGKRQIFTNNKGDKATLTKNADIPGYKTIFRDATGREIERRYYPTATAAKTDLEGFEAFGVSWFTVSGCVED